MRWPQRIPAAAVCNEPVMTIDILPTVAKLLGVTLDAERKIDGLEITSLMFAEAGAKTPHELLYFYWGDALHAVRSGPWKLHFPHDYRKFVKGGTGGMPEPYADGRTELALFNLADDVGETQNVASAHPEVVERLQKAADDARQDLGDSSRKQKGAGVREAGRLKE
jgi:arylsulfatase A-like enzyme